MIAGLLCAGGGILYSIKFPERIFKGKFDYIGNSHNMLHLLGIMAAILAMKGSIRMYHER